MEGTKNLLPSILKCLGGKLTYPPYFWEWGGWRKNAKWGVFFVDGGYILFLIPPTNGGYKSNYGPSFVFLFTKYRQSVAQE